jgi:hypothetical protein
MNKEHHTCDKPGISCDSCQRAVPHQPYVKPAAIVGALVWLIIFIVSTLSLSLAIKAFLLPE